MSEHVNALLISDQARAVLAEMSRRYESTCAALLKKVEAGEMSEIEARRQVHALIAELKSLSAPVNREIEAALALAHQEYSGVPKCLPH